MNAFQDRIASLPPEKRRLLERRLMEMQQAPSELAIRQREWTGPAPLSFAQERLWFLDRLLPGTPLYNMPLAFDIEGPIDVDCLRRSFDLLAARHGSLRMQYGFRDGAPHQTADPHAAPEHRTIAIGGGELDAALREEAGRPFDLTRDAMLRTAIFRAETGASVLLVNMPHIAGDGWSYSVLFRELSQICRALREGGDTALPPLPIDYRDFAAWQRDRLNGEALERELGYWRQRLNGARAPELPADYARPASLAWRGGLQWTSLPREVSERVTQHCAGASATPFMVLLAVCFALLERMTGGEDLVVAIPATNRPRIELEGIVGLFVNTLLVRVGVSPRRSFRGLVDDVRRATLEAQQYQDLPFEKLVAALHPARGINGDDYARVMFSYAAGSEAIEAPGLPLRLRPIETGTAKFDLHFHVRHGASGIAVAAEYRSDLFDGETVRRMLANYAALLEAAVAHPDQEAQALGVRRSEAAPTREPSPSCPRTALSVLFEEQVKSRPEAIAVAMGPERCSYAELNRRANRLARVLMDRGAGPEVCVGMMLPRSIDAIVAMLGILKSGAAYVPLDRSYPAERLRFLSSDCRMRLAIAYQCDADRIPEGVTPVWTSAWNYADAGDDRNPEPAATPDTLACVMYTSGSTGTPKGVEVLHRGIARLLFGADYARFGPGEVFLHAAPLSFDAATFEIWGALLHGGCCVIFPEGLPAPEDLGAAIREYGVTTVWLTAALFNLIIDEAPAALAPVRQLLVGGEALSVPHVRRALKLLPFTALVNGYGPTEATTFTCCYPIPRELPADSAAIPIGRPIANTEVHILDETGAPVAQGASGELYVGGDGVARGYLNREDLTRERFLPNRFTGRGKLYRTGDMVRSLPDGSLEFLGRADSQVKIRGHRIEPGEIEAVLLQHPDVRVAAVLPVELAPGERGLAAYVCGRDRDPSAGALREYLREKLPAYMIPARILPVREIPLKPNGKLDRAALVGGCAAAPTAPAPAALDETEARLAAIWGDLLGIEAVHPEANFFELGGHSLMTLQLVERVEKEFGRRLPVLSVFQRPTVRALAAELRSVSGAGAQRPLVAIQPKGARRPLFGIHDVRGQILLFGALSAQWGSDQPVYAVQPWGLAGARTIEELAAHYVREVRTVQPAGPYRLAGACFGGVVAFEMARRLEAEGERVEFLALIDAFAPGGLRRLRPLRALRVRCRLLGKRLVFHGRNLLALSGRETIRYIVRGCRTVRRRIAYRLWSPRGATAAPAETERAGYWAIQHYVAQPYGGSAVLFRARERSPLQRDITAGWGTVIRGGLEICEIPGDHLTMLSHPNRAVLAAEMGKRLNSVFTGIGL